MKLSIFVSLLSLMLMIVGISSQPAQGFNLNFPKGFEHLGAELTVLAGVSAIDTNLKGGFGVKNRAANLMELGAIASRTAEFMELGVITRKGDSAELQDLFLKEWKESVKLEVALSMFLRLLSEKSDDDDFNLEPEFFEKIKQALEDNVLLLDSLIRGDLSEKDYQQGVEEVGVAIESALKPIQHIIER